MHIMQIRKEKFEELEAIYGNYEQVAEALGISTRHYLRLKQSGEVTKSMGKLIDFLTKAG